MNVGDTSQEGKVQGLLVSVLGKKDRARKGVPSGGMAQAKAVWLDWCGWTGSAAVVVSAAW